MELPIVFHDNRFQQLRRWQTFSMPKSVSYNLLSTWVHAITRINDHPNNGVKQSTTKRGPQLNSRHNWAIRCPFLMLPRTTENFTLPYLPIRKSQRGSQGCCTIKIARHWHGVLDGEDTEAISNPIWTTKTMRQLARNTGLRRIQSGLQLLNHENSLIFGKITVHQ